MPVATIRLKSEDFSNASYSKFFLLSFQFFVTFMNCQFSIFLIKFMFEIF